MTESKGTSFWSTLPGIVTAIAGMVTALAVLATTLATLPIFKASESVPPSQPTAATASTGVPASEASSASPSNSSLPSGSADAGATPAPTPLPIQFYAVRQDPSSGLDNADLYALDPASGAERRVTTDATPDSYPAWSPNGQRIAFDSRRADGNRNIWVLEPDGSFTALTDDARDDGYPTWSPDGSLVAWAAGSGGAREIWLANASDGSDARRLTSGADDLLPSWSSTGLIAFERHVGASSEIWVVEPGTGGAAARITNDDGGGSDPVWSPDGSRIAFTRTVDGIRQIFVVNADGQSGLLALTPAAECDCEEPTWSPDGSQIAYVGPGSGAIRPILVVPASGGSPRRITTNGLGPSWAG